MTIKQLIKELDQFPDKDIEIAVRSITDNGDIEDCDIGFELEAEKIIIVPWEVDGDDFGDDDE